MLIKLNIAAIREVRWYQLAIRFALGGLITAIAGLITNAYGPSLGGVFLAFPAIFPASATLLEKQQRERKQKKGLNGRQRARDAVAADAFGSTIGATGLIAFALTAWMLLSFGHTVVSLMLATVVWCTVALTIWYAWKHDLFRRRMHGGTASLSAKRKGELLRNGSRRP